MAIIVKAMSKLIPVSPLRTAASLIAFLLPVFVYQPCYRLYKGLRSIHKPGLSKPTPIRHTAYLDGLRGVAAFIVYTFHFSFVWYPHITNGFGSNPSNRSFVQFTMVRLLYSGRASVAVFFVISGYVLSIKTLTLIHQGRTDRILDTLSGMAFRRQFRLYLPILAATGIMTILVRFRVYLADPFRRGAIPLMPTAWGQARQWFIAMTHLMNPCRVILPNRANADYKNPYGGYLWTIPVEAKGSLMIFVLLLMFGRIKTWIRMSLTLLFFCFQVIAADSDLALFTAGLLLAELSLYVLPSNADCQLTLKAEGSTPWFRRTNNSWPIHLITLPVFFLSLHFMSYPEKKGDASPGFRLMSSLVPKGYSNERVWVSAGSILLIFALTYSSPVSLCGRWRRQKTQHTYNVLDGHNDTENQSLMQPTDKEIGLSPTPFHAVSDDQEPRLLPLLQRPLTTTLCRFLGRVSYSLYLLHETVNHTIGTHILMPAWQRHNEVLAAANVLRNKGMMAEGQQMEKLADNAFFWAWVWGFIINTFVLLWVSDVFERAVDSNMVPLTHRISKWAWKK